MRLFINGVMLADPDVFRSLADPRPKAPLAAFFI
jgi:hypothetical protein